MSLQIAQQEIEHHYNKKTIKRMIKKDISETPELLKRFSKCFEMLQSTYLMGPHFHQKNQYLADINTDRLEETINTVLETIMVLPEGLTFSSLVGQTEGSLLISDKLTAFKITSSVISYMYYAGLVNLIRPEDSRSGMMEVTPVFICDKRILDHMKETMYLPPMLTVPETLTKNNSSGYMTILSDSLILKHYNHHNGDICLDSLNKFNSVAYSLDLKMLTTFDEEYKSKGKTRKGTPIIDSHQRREQFKTLMEDSYHVFKLLIQHGNDFHFTHKVDKRGRTYCQGYHVSTQGNSFRKAILNLKHEEVVNGNFN